MMQVFSGIAVLVACGAAMVFYAAVKAPVGFEDESGFHFGPEASAQPKEIGDALPEMGR
jgi:hypothetical protein